MKTGFDESLGFKLTLCGLRACAPGKRSRFSLQIRQLSAPPVKMPCRVLGAIRQSIPLAAGAIFLEAAVIKTCKYILSFEVILLAALKNAWELPLTLWEWGFLLSREINIQFSLGKTSAFRRS